MGLKMHELKSRQTPWTDNYGTKKRKSVKLFFRNELAIPRHDKHFKLLSFLHFVWSFLFSFPCCELSQNLCSTDDNAIAHYENNRAHKTKKGTWCFHRGVVGFSLTKFYLEQRYKIVLDPCKMNFRSEKLLLTTPFFPTYCYKSATTESQW